MKPKSVDDFEGLSTRAKNALAFAGITSRESAINALNAGWLHWNRKLPNAYGSKRIALIGKKTYNELAEFFGVPPTSA